MRQKLSPKVCPIYVDYRVQLQQAFVFGKTQKVEQEGNQKSYHCNLRNKNFHYIINISIFQLIGLCSTECTSTENG